MERRDLFRIIGAAAATAGSALPQTGSAPRFFSSTELSAIQALCGAIIPADEEAGGAIEAGVPRYIDTVGFYSDAANKEAWRGGLEAVEKLASSSYRKKVAELSDGERAGLLTQLAKNERAPSNDAERFFMRLKAVTIEAYFQSDIGIKYSGHKGHSGLQPFPGCTHPEHLKT